MKKSKFNYNQHIIDHYVSEDRNRVFIKVLVDNLDHFYHCFDPRKISINPDIVEYITSEVDHIPFRYKVTIEFFSDELADEEKDKITTMIKNYYGMKICNVSSIIRTNIVKSICLILLGALMITYAAIGKSFFGFIYEEIVYVIGWVLLWEGIDIFLLSNSEHKVKRRTYKQLYDANIIFSDKF